MFEMSDIKSAYSMNLFLYSKKSGIERTVMSYYDDTHWVFYDTGEPIEIENLNYYKVRLKKERISRNIVMEYMSKLGIIKNEKRNTMFKKIDKKITDYLNFTRTQW